VETVLSGSDARELYLGCYQLILCKQCHWLVNTKGFPKELETVVRDLWGLRLGILQRVGGERSGYGSGTGTMMFSSTSEGENTDTGGTGGKSLSSRRSRKSVVSEERLPRLVETLGLCYLGTLLLRLPTSLGEFYRWATREEMIYTRAVSRFSLLLVEWVLINLLRSKKSPKRRGPSYLATSTLLSRLGHH
jgi:RNA polymerase I-specific transcription initiation factor RRN7